MALFQKKQPEPEPETTGTDVVREALRVRSKSPMFSTANLARDLGVPDSVLTNFIASGVRPRSDTMHALVKFLLHGHAIWDEELDRLKSANSNPAKSLCAGFPAQHASFRTAEDIAAFFGAPPPTPTGAPITVYDPLPPKPRTAQPGWAD